MYNAYNLEKLNRTKSEIEDLIRTYQSGQSVNNFFSTPKEDIYVMKILNDGENGYG